MTEYKEVSESPRYRSLYFGLLSTLIRGAVLSVIAWLVIMLSSYYVIGVYYTTPDMKAERRQDYAADLCAYVEANGIELDNADRIAGWVRENPHVYLLVFRSEVNSDGETVDRVSVHSGPRIDESISGTELYSTAVAGGYYDLPMKNGSVRIAIAEYTEDRYYSIFNFVSITVGIIVFVLALVNYVRRLIERIKRFESDVTIVSEIDMDYTIVSEGADEIANLSGKVDQMRLRMLEHIKSEHEAREANTELITAISHDIRTPLTVLMGYIEMMQKHETEDELMKSYISSTESTAMRLKQLSDDMFKYSLAFGETEKSVRLEEYDAETLFDQLFAEHILLMSEMGYDISYGPDGEDIRAGSVVNTDAPNLMRIIDNIFSNLRKYADVEHPITITRGVKNGRLWIECRNKVRKDTNGAESNGIGLKTCVRLASLIADKFEYKKDGDIFTCRLTINIREASEQ